MAKNKIQSEETRKRLKMVKDAIVETSVPQELKLAYMVATSCQLLLSDADRRIRAIYTAAGFKPGTSDTLKSLNSYCKAVRMANSFFEMRIDSNIVDFSFNDRLEKGYSEEDATKLYDAFQDSASELVRLLMLYIDRCAINNDNYGKVFKTLRELEGSGMFSDKDITRFKMK